MQSNTVEHIVLAVSDTQHRAAGIIHLFKITDTLVSENVSLKWKPIWDIIEIDWKAVSMTWNWNVINLPKSVMVKFWDKFKIRHIVKRETLLFDIMLKQGFTWFTLTFNNPPETV